MPRWAYVYVDGTGGLKGHKSRCRVIGTLMRHQAAPIVFPIAATESKLAVRFVFSSVKKALDDEFQFEWDLDLLVQDGALGMFGAAAGLFSAVLRVLLVACPTRIA